MYYIVNPNNTITDIPDNLWFSNPIKKEGSRNKWMCEETGFRITFYKYGIKSNFEYRGWLVHNDIHIIDNHVPYMYRGEKYSRRVKEISFKATCPFGNSYTVCARMEYFNFNRLFQALEKLSSLSHDDILKWGYKYPQDDLYHLNMGDYFDVIKHLPLYFD